MPRAALGRSNVVRARGRVGRALLFDTQRDDIAVRNELPAERAEYGALRLKLGAGRVRLASMPRERSERLLHVEERVKRWRDYQRLVWRG